MPVTFLLRFCYAVRFVLLCFVNISDRMSDSVDAAALSRSLTSVVEELVQKRNELQRQRMRLLCVLLCCHLDLLVSDTSCSL